ncbi:sigma-70 family RNA polymerase sigma factor [Hymenobacter sp. UYCo722]|uniref:RNA polymerase sigma factor n=1 Tax=Hymenobacter sp. UYCo722 TaxID=3156335 RepID=UPI0033978948
MNPVPAPREAAPDEALLIQRLLARDEQALRLLYARYANNLLAVVLRLVRDEALAQDVLQEAWLKVWLSFASYDAERGRLFTWLARVCSNHAVDMLRSPRYRFHSQTRSLEGADAAWVAAPVSFQPEHIGVRDLTRQLKPRQREVIDLLYFGGCTQAEAAEELGIPLATVKTRARAAIRVLAGLARAGPVPLLREGST